MIRLIPLVLATVVACAAAPPTTVAKHKSNNSSGTDPSNPDDSSSSCDPDSTNCANAPTATGGTGIVLRGGSVLDPDTQQIEQRDVFICQGVIVDETRAKTCATTDVDVSGKWIMPSLTDMHVHARGVSLGNEDFVDMTVDDEAALFRKGGVTGFLDSMNDEAKIFPARDAQRAQATKLGADIFCSGGPFTPTGGHGTEYGLPLTSFRIVNTPGDVDRQMTDLVTNKPDVIKIFYDHRGDDGGPDVPDGGEGALGIAMKKEVMQSIIAEATAKGFKTQVHIGVWSDARDAIEAGATAIAHLGEPVIPADIAGLAHDHNVYWIPTISLYHGLTDIIANQALLDDPLLVRVIPADIIASYRSNKINVDTFTKAWLARHVNDSTNVAALKNAGVRILAGTDVVEVGMFPGWSLHRELVLLTQAGLSKWEALATATTLPGGLLGHKYGVATGSEANLLVLDASPIDDIWNTTKINKVVHHGQVVTD